MMKAVIYVRLAALLIIFSATLSLAERVSYSYSWPFFFRRFLEFGCTSNQQKKILDVFLFVFL